MTRASELALAEATYVAKRAERELCVTAELAVIETRGDLMNGARSLTCLRFDTNP